MSGIVQVYLVGSGTCGFSSSGACLSGASAMVEAARPCVITCCRTISGKGAVAVSLSKDACRKDRFAVSMVPLAWPSASCITLSWGSVWCSRKGGLPWILSLGRVVLGYHGRLRVAGSIPVACGDPAVAPFFFSWSHRLFWPYSRPVRLVPRAPVLWFFLLAKRVSIVPYRLRRGGIGF